MSSLAHRNYVSSSDEEDETTPIMNGQRSGNSELMTEVFTAVHGLNHLVIITFWTAIIELSILVAYAYQDYQYQLYMLFVGLWLGHILFFVQLFRIYSRIKESFLPSTSSAADVDAAKYFTFSEDIEELIPLTLFLVHNVTWIFSAALFVLISEILFFFYLINMAPAYAGFVPLYIRLFIPTVSYIVCKSANVLSILSTLIFAVGLILVNIKMCLNPSDVDWLEALTPFSLLVFGWLLIMLYVAFCYVFQYYKLKVSQVISMALYIVSFVGYLISINFLSAYLLMSPGDFNYQLETTLMSFIVSTLVLFISVWIDVRNYLNTIVNRMGNELPVALKRVHPRDGSTLMDDNVVGYDADPNRAVRSFILLGEIELTSAGEASELYIDEDADSEQLRRSLFESFFTSCCSSTIEMLLYTKSSKGRKRRSRGGSSSSGDRGGIPSYDGSDSSLSSPRGGPGRRPHAAMRRGLSSEEDSLDEGDEESSSYERQKQRQYRLQQQALLDGKKDRRLPWSSSSSEEGGGGPHRTPVA